MILVSRGITGQEGHRLPREVFDGIYQQVPRLCVDILIETNVGVVLSKRDIDPGRGLWHIPGGTVQRPESVQDTAVRIAKAETGLEVGALKLAGLIEYAPDKDAVGQSVSLVFLTTITGGTLHGSSEGWEIGVFQINQLPNPIIPEVAQFISQIC